MVNGTRRLPGIDPEEDEYTSEYEEEDRGEDLSSIDLNEELPVSDQLKALLFENYAKKEIHNLFSLLTKEVATTYFKDEKFPREFSHRVKHYAIIYFLTKDAFSEDHAKAILSPLIAQDIAYAYSMKSYEGFVARLIFRTILPTRIGEERQTVKWGWFFRRR